MSLSAMSTIALQRDSTTPTKTVRALAPPAVGGAGSGGEAALGLMAATPPTSADAATTPQTEAIGYTAVLIAAIPTEPLALYTTTTAGILGLTTDQQDWLTVRWAFYAGFIVFIVGFLGTTYLRAHRAAGTSSDDKRAFPWVESASAAVAFATWGLVMPGSPLSEELHGNARGVWSLLITAIGVGLLALLGTSLKDPASTAGDGTAPEA